MFICNLKKKKKLLHGKMSTTLKVFVNKVDFMVTIFNNLQYNRSSEVIVLTYLPVRQWPGFNPL